MNREIKFRAWDLNNKRMIYPNGNYGSDLYWKLEGSNNGFWGMFNGGKRLCGNADKSGILMQYTGLKDINDKEIYEGDIVNIIVNNNVKNYGKIIFKDGCYVVSIDIPEITPSLDWIIGVANVEIIGNIYDNPELLEESKDNERY